MTGIIQNLLFSFWLSSFNILFVRFIHVVVCSSSVFFLSLYHIHLVTVAKFYFIHSTFAEYLVCFQLLNIMNKVVGNVIVNVVWHSYIYIWLSRCTGSYVSLCLASVIYAKLYQIDFQVVVPVYFPTSNVWEFQLFHSYQSLMLSVLKFSCPGG